MAAPATAGELGAQDHQRIALLDLRREYRLRRAELQAAWERTLERMQLLGGEEVKLFEQEAAAYLGAAHAIGVASGTDALHLAVRACGVRAGDEVILQANAFVAALEAVLAVGAQPVLVDIKQDDYGPDPEEVARRVSPRTRAIIVVHLYGLPVDLRAIVEIARARHLVLIEDCSHAHGATYAGRRVGTFGAAGAFSLGVVKNLSAYGDAGLVATNDAEIARAVRRLRAHGQERKNEHLCYGTNSRLDEMNAAALRVKLRYLDARNRRRRAIAAYYSERFSRYPVGVPGDLPGRTHVYHQYVLRCPWRDALRSFLAERGIETGIHYPHPLHCQPAWHRTFSARPSCPRAEGAAREIVSLPVHPELTDAEVERVAGSVVDFLQRQR